MSTNAKGNLPVIDDHSINHLKDNTNPLYQALSGMMSQFFRDAVTSGDLAAVFSAAAGSSAPVPSPLPVLPVPAPTPYTSTRLALPSAALGHPVPSNLPPFVAATQPILGVSSLGISLSGHSNHACGAGTSLCDLTAAQISQANDDRLDAACLHLGPAGPTHHVRGSRRTRGPAIRPPVLAPPKSQTTLDKVSTVTATGTRVIRVTHLVQAYQNAQEVVNYKNFKSAHQRFLAQLGLSFDYDLPEHTAVSQILQMTATNMRTGPRTYVFGTIPSGPSTRQQHEALDLQILVYLNMGKNRGNGNCAAHLKRESLDPALTLQELFDTDYKNQYALRKHCILGRRFLLHLIVRFDGITFIETIPGALPRTHSCLTLRQNQQFNESIEMNFEEHDIISDSSGGVPASNSESESEDEDMPQAPSLIAATPPTPTPRPLPSRNSRAPFSSNSVSATTPGGESVSAARSISTPAVLAAGPAQSSSTSISSRLAGPPIVPFIDFTQNLPSTAVPTPALAMVQPATTLPWPATLFIPVAGPYGDLFSRVDLPAAIYQAGGEGVLDVWGENMDDLAAAYIHKVRMAAILEDYSQLLNPVRSFKIVKSHGTVHSLGDGIQNECIFTALNLFLSDSGRRGLVTDEDCLSLVTSMPLRLASSVAPGQLLEALGATGSLAPFQGEIISTLGVQIAVLSLRDEKQHDALVSQFIHTGILGPELHNHPETDAFANGVELPCSTGFSFGQLARSYPGGTEFYLAEAWTSFIPNAAALDPFLVVTAPSATKLAPHFGTTANNLEPEVLFTGFLQRSGNPCDPAAFLDVQVHIHPDVIAQLPNIDSPSFRPRMLCWVATGSPFLHADQEQNNTIAVHFVLPNDSNYSNNPVHSAAHMRHGTISFRSCMRVVRVPMLKLVELHQAAGSDAFQDEMDSWLLLQILNVIGKVSKL
ncbi:hypothetical protein B0H16DRAFT_1480244 [Mycena metata]|uniref:Uncharacterized protein n=1 Tax=Mycena metata TaxID=1033252 RepID=A0AAD7H4D1_9AGAR|nr:hypothetical protein B0H16DRAFT_1480244 [Mycena metata]